MVILETWTITPPPQHPVQDPNAALALTGDADFSGQHLPTAGHHPAQGTASRTGHCKFRNRPGSFRACPRAGPMEEKLGLLWDDLIV